jgi:hypothetical protein
VTVIDDLDAPTLHLDHEALNYDTLEAAGFTAIHARCSITVPTDRAPYARWVLAQVARRSGRELIAAADTTTTSFILIADPHPHSHTVADMRGQAS